MTDPACDRELASLYQLYGPVVYRRCLRLLDGPEAARDATRVVFARLLQDLPRSGRLRMTLPWVYSATTRFCAGLRRPAEPPPGEPGAWWRRTAARARALIN